MWIVVTPTFVSVLLTAVMPDVRESTDVLILAISFSYLSCIRTIHGVIAILMYLNL